MNTLSKEKENGRRRKILLFVLESKRRCHSGMVNKGKKSIKNTNLINCLDVLVTFVVFLDYCFLALKSQIVLILVS